MAKWKSYWWAFNILEFLNPCVVKLFCVVFPFYKKLKKKKKKRPITFVELVNHLRIQVELLKNLTWQTFRTENSSLNYQDIKQSTLFSFYPHSVYPHIFLPLALNFTKSAILSDNKFSRYNCWIPYLFLVFCYIL